MAEKVDEKRLMEKEKEIRKRMEELDRREEEIERREKEAEMPQDERETRARTVSPLRYKEKRAELFASK